MGRPVANARRLDQVVMCSVAVSCFLLVASCLGFMESSPLYHLVVLLAAGAYFLHSLLSRGDLTPSEELDGKLRILDGQSAVVPCLLVAVTSDSTDMALLGAGIVSVAFLIHILRVFVELQDGHVCRCPPRIFTWGLPLTFIVARSFYCPHAAIVLKSSMALTPFMWCASVMVDGLKTELLTARAKLQQELRRMAETSQYLQTMNLQLVGTKYAMCSILTALCDNVVTLDSSLRIMQPSGQLCELLQPDFSNTFDEVSGRKFIDFLASEDEVPQVERWLNSEHALSSRGSRVAAAFNMWLKDTKGRQFRVEAFHSSFETEGEGSKLTHHIGFRMHVETAQQRSSGSTAPVERAEVTATAGSLMPPSSSRVPTPFSGQRSDDRSVLALRFDAGDAELSLLNESFLETFLRPSRGCQGLLHWMSRADGARFQQAVSRHVQFAPWDRATTVPLGHQVVLRIPRDAGYLTAEMAVLEMEPLTNERGHDVPVTLWLRGMKFLHHHGAEFHLPESLTRLDEVRDWESESVCSDSLTCSAD